MFVQAKELKPGDVIDLEPLVESLIASGHIKDNPDDPDYADHVEWALKLVSDEYAEVESIEWEDAADGDGHVLVIYNNVMNLAVSPDALVDLRWTKK